MSSGFYGIGIVRPKTTENVGTLLRSAEAFGAAFVFLVGRRFKRQASDVWSSWKRVPVYEYATVNDLRAGLPYACPLIGVELDERAQPLTTFCHPPRAVYLLGAEDNGIPANERSRCHSIVQIPGASACLNVASAGSIVMFDRVAKESRS